MGESLLISDASGTDVDEIKTNTIKEMICTVYFLKDPASTFVLKQVIPLRITCFLVHQKGLERAARQQAG